MLLIKNGTVHTGRGEVLNNTDILIRDRIIERIEKGISQKADKVIEANGLEVYPGFIDPVSVIGCHDGRMYDNNDTISPINSDLQVYHAFDSAHFLMQEYYDVGLTTMGVSAWHTNILGGLMSIYKTFGTSSQDMLYKRSCIMKGSLTTSVKKTFGPKNKLPMTKMGMLQLLEKAFVDAETYDPKKGPRDFKKENVKRVISGEIPLFMACNKATEIFPC